MPLLLPSKISIFRVAPTCLMAGLMIPWTSTLARLPATDVAVMTAPQVTVVGRAQLPELGGAGQIIGPKELETSRVLTANEALRKVPGVNVRDEEGFGLRPNIGIRGLNPTRSTKITLLEDGIPLAYAPYGDNASYYHPPIDRYRSVEVLKGASSLLFGPQTIGGVINYVTPNPPSEFGGYVQGTFGNRDYINGRLSIGGNGLLLDYTRKQGNGARDNLEHAIDDLNLKYVTSLTANQALTLRANVYQEDSTVTYSGLTRAEFERQGPRYNPFRNDRFDTDRLGLSATHEYDFGAGATLLTNVYYSKFDRDWWRQASTSQDGQCGGGFNAARLAGTVVNPDACNSVQGRLRSYTTYGVEPRLTVPHRLGEFQAGLKAHFEEQDRQQINGTSPAARSGTLVENNRRQTDAYSGFLANRFIIGRFGVTPIVRYESIEVNRTNRLTSVSGSTSLTRTMPGVGATWNPHADLTVFSSLHKGFAPPRVEDLIGGNGTIIEVGPEKSTNFEFGVRAVPASWVSIQAAYFRNDFDNLIAVGSIAGGNTPLSQGKALFEGLELGAQAAFANGVFGRLAYTWLPTAEQTEAFRNVASGAVIGKAGNRQPYTPKNTLTAAAGYETGAFRGEIEAQYVGTQFSDFANTGPISADGQRGEIDAYAVWNAALNYRFDKSVTGFLALKNITDEAYIVDLTRGIQVGMPRLVQVGMRYGF